MQDPTPEQILSLNNPIQSAGNDPVKTPGLESNNDRPSYEQLLEEHKNNEEKKKGSSIGWIIFWLIGLTPVGWYMVWKKTNWPRNVKIAVILLTAIVFIALLWESEQIAFQLSNSASSLGGSDLPGLGY